MKMFGNHIKRSIFCPHCGYPDTSLDYDIGTRQTVIECNPCGLHIDTGKEDELPDIRYSDVEAEVLRELRWIASMGV